MMGAGKRWAAGALVVVVLLSAAAAYATSVKDLPPRYREWLTRDVAYIITNEERQAFLLLPSDEARDKFIEHFWELRNPTPGAPSNPYKDEIYERIAYANQWFGHPGRGDGWATDQGRIYITLGPPAQRAKYVSQATIRPMEIWFYSNSHPALPPFFYIVFFQREVGDEYRLYSPYVDGPGKLVSKSGTENDPQAALKEIDTQLGREVARTTLSLLPDAPVDWDSARADLTSDVMLATVVGLANNPANKDLLREKEMLLQAVSHRVILGSEYLDVLTVPLVDRQGNPFLHYVLRLKRPEDFTLAEGKDGKYYFNSEVVAHVSTADNKLIFTQVRKISKYLSAGQVQQVKNKVVGYEGMLALPPGKYKIEFLMSNELGKTAFRESRDVVVPRPPASGLVLTDIVPFSDAVAEPPGMERPFTMAGVKFTPMIGQGISVVQGANFKFFYQIWAPPADPRSYGQGKLNVEYAYGRMGLRDTHSVKDELLKSQFDEAGTLINGKKLSTAELPLGNYRLVVTVNDPDTRQKAFSSLSFHVVSSEGPISAWDLTDEDALKEEAQRGIPEYDRGLCYLAQGQADAALQWMKRGYEKNPQDESIRGKLVDLLFARQDFAQIAKLYGAGGISPRTDEQTILRMAESLDKLGQVNKSIQLLESALPLKESSALYLTLAGYYQKAGNLQKASEMERKGKAVAGSAPPS